MKSLFVFYIFLNARYFFTECASTGFTCNYHYWFNVLLSTTKQVGWVSH